MKKVVLGILTLVVVIVIINSASHKSSGSPANSRLGSGTVAHPATADVVLSGCTVDEIGVPQGTATITNHSSKTSNYTFGVSFINSAGTVVAQGAGFEQDIASGQTAKASVIGDQTNVSAPLTCQVTDVTRLAS